MKSISILLVFILSIVFPKGEINNRNSINSFNKVYYHKTHIETDDYSVIIKNIIDYKNIIKFSLKLSNKTKGFIIYSSNETKVNINATELNIKGRTKTIKPTKNKSFTIKCERGSIKRQESFNVLVDGIYKINQNVKSIELKDFEIPMTKKDFSFGNIFCDVEIPVRKTQKMVVKIKMRNDGDKYIIIHQSRVGVAMPDGKTYLSKNNKSPILLAPHTTEKMTLKWDRMPKGGLNDMQKVDMGIVFKDVFYFAEKVKLKTNKTKIEWDKQLTIKKQ